MITRLTSSSSRFGVNEYHQEFERWVSRLRKRLQTRQRLMWGGSLNALGRLLHVEPRALPIQCRRSLQTELSARDQEVNCSAMSTK